MFPGVTLAGWVIVPIVGGVLIVGGFACLFYLIPPTRHTSSTRVELYLTKASYGAIVVGLVCTTSWLLAAVVVRSLAVLKFWSVVH